MDRMNVLGIFCESRRTDYYSVSFLIDWAVLFKLGKITWSPHPYLQRQSHSISIS